MRDEWYVARRGQDGNKRYGPVPLHQLRELMDSGRVQGNDLVWREGMGSWQRADQCADLGVPQPARPEPRGCPAPDRRGDNYGYDHAPRGYGRYDDDRPYRRPYPRQSSSTWVVPLVIVVAGLVIGGIAFGGVMCVTRFNNSSASSGYYNPPTYYQPAVQPWQQQPEPVEVDPGPAIWNPPPDPGFVVPPDPPFIVDPNPPFIPDPFPPPDDNRDPP